MYSFHDADYRAAKAAMIAYMDQGYRWDAAAQMAGVVVSRATAYRLWLRAWREGPDCLDDGRHGHPSKLRDPIRQWLVETCTAAPTTSSPVLQTAIRDRLGITVSVRQINRVRAALGVRAVRSTPPKKRWRRPSQRFQRCRKALAACSSSPLPRKPGSSRR